MNMGAPGVLAWNDLMIFFLHHLTCADRFPGVEKINDR